MGPISDKRSPTRWNRLGKPVRRLHEYQGYEYATVLRESGLWGYELPSGVLTGEEHTEQAAMALAMWRIDQEGND